MDKIKITIISLNGKRYATFKVDPQFASAAFRADYRDLPRNGERVEVRPGDEEKIIAEVNRKVAEAETAIARHEEFMRSPHETRTLEVAGYKVTVHFEPSDSYFFWKVRVFVPTALKNELNEHSLLAEDFDKWQDEEDGTFSLFTIVREKERYLGFVEAEMKKVAVKINQLREWRAQPPQHYELPGEVQVTISPHPQWGASYYKAEVVAPKKLIEKAKECNLKLGNCTWWSQGDAMTLTYPLHNLENIAAFLDNIRSEVEETLATEIVEEYSV